MRYWSSRKRRISPSRVTDAQRTAVENAYLDSVQHPPPLTIPIYDVPSLKQKPLKQRTVQEQVATYRPPPMGSMPRPYVPTTKERRESASGVVLGCLIVSIIIVAGMLFTLLATPPPPPYRGIPVPSDTVPTINAAAPSFCSTQTCAPTFPNGTGTLVECNDGTYSHAGGRRGACSYHGGEYPRSIYIRHRR